VSGAHTTVSLRPPVWDNPAHTALLEIYIIYM
jgi:hypothetical protein